MSDIGLFGFGRVWSQDVVRDTYDVVRLGGLDLVGWLVACCTCVLMHDMAIELTNPESGCLSSDRVS